mmetsp:Transcript_54854/g.66096  ORF Transcript_54854/g.66096 Transcript_54854/m.66096 type:complete len:98 (+) Transcript_54854:2903-3196(+)
MDISDLPPPRTAPSKNALIPMVTCQQQHPNALKFILTLPPRLGKHWGIVYKYGCEQKFCLGGERHNTHSPSLTPRNLPTPSTPSLRSLDQALGSFSR